MNAFLKTVTQATGAVVLFSLSSCATLSSSMLPGGLADALGSVTQLSSTIGQFAGQLSPNLKAAGLDMAGFGQLTDFASKAGVMSDQLSGFGQKLTGAAADPLGAITKQLGDMGNLNVDALKNMPGMDQFNAIKGFTDNAASVGTSATDFLSKFGG